MNNEQTDSATACAGDISLALAPDAIEWRAVAKSRLGRLVDIEHDAALLHERLSGIQVEYRLLLATDEDRLARIRELDGSCRRLARQLENSEREYRLMESTFLHSHSWRVTRPLRALRGLTGSTRRGVGVLLRALLGVPWLRKVVRIVARMVPGLHKRLRSRLYPHG